MKSKELELVAPEIQRVRFGVQGFTCPKKIRPFPLDTGFDSGALLLDPEFR